MTSELNASTSREDTDANVNRDSSGMGRIANQRRRAPSRRQYVTVTRTASQDSRFVCAVLDTQEMVSAVTT